LSDAVDAVLTSVAGLTGWLVLAAIFVICFDDVTGTLGFHLL
jgi:hypothetical protein